VVEAQKRVHSRIGNRLALDYGPPAPKQGLAIRRVSLRVFDYPRTVQDPISHVGVERLHIFTEHVTPPARSTNNELLAADEDSFRSKMSV
jgi:hypothetical protein